jgi:hypothetical protein
MQTRFNSASVTAAQGKTTFGTSPAYDEINSHESNHTIHSIHCYQFIRCSGCKQIRLRSVENFAWIVQIQQRATERISKAVARRNHAMIEDQPAILRFDWNRACTDLCALPRFATRYLITTSHVSLFLPECSNGVGDITCLCLPQNTMSGEYDMKTSPNFVCPLSLGRESIANRPLIFSGNKTPFRLYGNNAFSHRKNCSKSSVYATPMHGPPAPLQKTIQYLSPIFVTRGSYL